MGPRGDARVLEWVKPYKSGLPVPPGQKVSAAYAGNSPNSVTLRILTDGGHQGMGQFAVFDDRVEVEALTLSRASVLMSTLLAAAGGPVTITASDWRSAVPHSRAQGGGSK